MSARGVAKSEIENLTPLFTSQTGRLVFIFLSGPFLLHMSAMLNGKPSNIETMEPPVPGTSFIVTTFHIMIKHVIFFQTVVY